MDKLELVRAVSSGNVTYVLDIVSKYENNLTRRNYFDVSISPLLSMLRIRNT